MAELPFCKEVKLGGDVEAAATFSIIKMALTSGFTARLKTSLLDYRAFSTILPTFHAKHRKVKYLKRTRGKGKEKPPAMGQALDDDDIDVVCSLTGIKKSRPFNPWLQKPCYRRNRPLEMEVQMDLLLMTAHQDPALHSGTENQTKDLTFLNFQNNYNHNAFKQWVNVEFQELIKVPSKFDAKAKRDTGVACNSSCRQSPTASAPLNVHSDCDLLGDQVHVIASDLQRHGFRSCFYSQLKMKRVVKNSPLFDMTVSPHAREWSSGQTGHVNLQGVVIVVIIGGGVLLLLLHKTLTDRMCPLGIPTSGRSSNFFMRKPRANTGLGNSRVYFQADFVKYFEDCYGEIQVHGISPEAYGPLLTSHNWLTCDASIDVEIWVQFCAGDSGCSRHQNEEEITTQGTKQLLQHISLRLSESSREITIFILSTRKANDDDDDDDDDDGNGDGDDGDGDGGDGDDGDGDGDGDDGDGDGGDGDDPNEKQKEGKREQDRQDQREPSSDDGWRYRRRPTLEHRTEPPKVQMRSRRRKNMKNEIRTARRLSRTHSEPPLLRAAADTGKQVALLSSLQQAKILRQAKKDKGPGVCSSRHQTSLQMTVQEGEYPNRLDPKNLVYAKETSPSVIVNDLSERLRASHIQRIRPHSENLVGSQARSVPVQLALILTIWTSDLDLPRYFSVTKIETEVAEETENQKSPIAYTGTYSRLDKLQTMVVKAYPKPPERQNSNYVLKPQPSGKVEFLSMDRLIAPQKAAPGSIVDFKHSRFTSLPLLRKCWPAQGYQLNMEKEVPTRPGTNPHIRARSGNAEGGKESQEQMKESETPPFPPSILPQNTKLHNHHMQVQIIKVMLLFQRNTLAFQVCAIMPEFFHMCYQGAKLRSSSQQLNDITTDFNTCFFHCQLPPSLVTKSMGYFMQHVNVQNGRFKFSIGLEQCLNPHAVTRGAIDLGIREDLMQISKKEATPEPFGPKLNMVPEENCSSLVASVKTQCNRLPRREIKNLTLSSLATLHLLRIPPWLVLAILVNSALEHFQQLPRLAVPGEELEKRPPSLSKHVCKLIPADFKPQMLSDFLNGLLLHSHHSSQGFLPCGKFKFLPPPSRSRKGESPNRLERQNPVYAEEASPSVIVNGFSKRLRDSYVALGPVLEPTLVDQAGPELTETCNGFTVLDSQVIQLYGLQSWLSLYHFDPVVTKYIIGTKYTREEVYSKEKKTADFMVMAAGKELVEKKEEEKDEAEEEKEEEKKEEKKEERRRRKQEAFQGCQQNMEEQEEISESNPICLGFSLTITREVLPISYEYEALVLDMVQEGECPDRLDPKNPVYAEEASPSVIVNGFSERLQASHIQRIRPHSENLVQEGECPNRLDPQNPVYVEETGPSVIVNGFSERLRASHSHRIRPNSKNLFIYMMDYIDRFAYFEPALHLWNEADLIIMDNFSNVRLDSIVGGGLALASAHLFDQMLSIGTSGIGSGSLVGQGVH
ncbi:hypothetical protein U0070_003732 [Myodes glareolus]|uniref:Uncharacterized protein n=1 Tax=Myodes glareolus TaxID=447135 RepID=A0AAW0J630_MYOGA